MTTQYIPTITPPIVNLNGATQASLVAQHMNVVERLRHAQQALMDAFPHGRDFQTTDEATYRKAAAEARERAVTLEKLIMDFEALALAIWVQSDGSGGAS